MGDWSRPRASKRIGQALRESTARDRHAIETRHERSAVRLDMRIASKQRKVRPRRTHGGKRFRNTRRAHISNNARRIGRARHGLLRTRMHKADTHSISRLRKLGFEEQIEAQTKDDISHEPPDGAPP